jgi:hypothetical protein
MSGYIRLHRTLMDNPVWTQMPNERLKLWLTMLLRANYRASKVLMKDGSQVDVPPGSLLTSLEDLHIKSGLTIKQVRTGIASFEKAGMIRSDRAYRGTVITLLNWASYNGQGHDEGTERAQEGHKEGTERHN